MSTAEKFNRLGQSKVPKKLARKLPDLMDIIRLVPVNDGAGGQSGETETITNDGPIPCFYDPTANPVKGEKAERIGSEVEYTILFPFCDPATGEAYDIQAKDRLKIAERGEVGEQLMRIQGLENVSGIIWQAVCTKEN